MSSTTNESPSVALGQRLHKFFRYRQDASIHEFVAFQINGSQIIYSTDKAVFTTSTGNFMACMADWTELGDEEVAKHRPLPATVDQQQVGSYVPKLPELPSGMTDNFSKMFDTLSFAIEQTKQSKEFVEQAKTINTLVQSGINLGKLQVDAHRLFLGK